MFDFLKGLIEEEVQKYKENPGAYELETKKYSKLDTNLISQHGNKVNYYLAYAIKVIAKNPNISPENPMVLKGTNPISSKYLWTALMIIGSVLPTKFDHRSIKNWVSGFDPASEMGSLWGFKTNSLYETEFKKHVNNREVKRFLTLSTTVIENQSMQETPPSRGASQLTRQMSPSFSSLQTTNHEQNAPSPLDEKKMRDDALLVAKRQQEQKQIAKAAEETKLKEQAKLVEDTRLKKESLEKKERVTASFFSAVANTQAVVKLSHLQKLLNDGADIDYQGRDGNTALMNAIDAQNDRVTEFLLKKGANPLLADKFGNTAATLISNASPVFELLQSKIAEKQQQNESPALKLNKLLHKEIANFDCQTRKIKQLLNQGADINYQDESGFTPLMLAVDRQNDRIAEYLLSQGADPLLFNNDNEIASDLASRNSPLYEILKGYELLYAVFNGDLMQIKILLIAGVDINFQGLGGYTPLLIAVEQEHSQLVEYLLSQGARTDLIRKDGLGVFDIVAEGVILELLQTANSSPIFEEHYPDSDDFQTFKEGDSKEENCEHRYRLFS